MKMNIAIAIAFLTFGGITFYAMQEGSILTALLTFSLGLCPVGLVWAGNEYRKLNERENIRNGRGKYLQEKLAFAWALESMIPAEYKPYVRYDAHDIYVSMKDDYHMIPNNPYIAEVKNYYLDNMDWDVFVSRAEKKYRKIYVN